MRMMRALFATFSCLALSSGLVLAEQAPRPALQTYTVAPSSVADEQVFDAVIEAVNQSTVSAQASGRVIEVNFDVDDFVPKGSVLLRLRDTEQQAALKAAQARFNEAKTEYDRARELVAKKLVAKAVFDKAQAAWKAASADLERAREQLEHTVIRAPFSGIVTERHIEVGETASPGKPLMSGLSLEQLRATANVSQKYISTIRSLSRARVILPKGDSVEATDLTFSPYANPQTHTFQVRVELPTGSHEVYPGMFAKVAFMVGEAQRLLVPGKAVAYRSEVTAVYVVDESGRIRMRQVRLGYERPDGMVEVLAGLGEGEKVATDPIRAGVALKEARMGSGS